ncbi:MAG: head GIN domain-containing protein [Gammaproteobacteria bacterium]
MVSNASFAFAGSYDRGQESTGVIIIDGVVYGGGGSQVSKGSGNFDKDQRSVSRFNEVKVLGGFDVIYRRDSEQRVEISGDHNLLSLVTTEVSGGVLIVGSKKSYQTRLPLTVELSSPELSSFSMRGAGDITLNDLRGNVLRLDLNGSGDIKAQGRVSQLSINLTGASDVHAMDLVSDDADVRLMGSGDLDLTVHRLLKVQITGSGDVTYYGNPEKIEKRIIGSGDIEAGE